MIIQTNENMKATENQKSFNMSHVCGKQATQDTLALFNSCRPVEVDSKGKFIWVGISTKDENIIATKEYTT